MNTAQFFNTLKSENLEGKWNRMLDWFGFYSANYDLTIWLPPGFVLDFDSVPRYPFVYWLFGRTGKWEGAIHDLPYRWRYEFVTRSIADSIFREARQVRSEMRSNQSWHYRFGRYLRKEISYATVVVAGGSSFKQCNGALDYRLCQDCNQVKCAECDNYFPGWKHCVKQGFHPEIPIIQGSL